MGAQSDKVAAALNQAMHELKLEFARRLVEKLHRETPLGPPRGPGYVHARDAWSVAAAGSAVDVINLKPYIMRLNDGWSAQAAAGFIERCIDEVIVEMGIVIKRPTRILLSEAEVFEYHPAEAA